MKSANWDRLKNNVLRPDIDKFLVPLMLYRGTRGFGWMHRCWNFALHCMESDVLSYCEAVRLSHNPDFVHLATGVKKVTHPNLSSIFGRLLDNPRVTDNIPGFTEYVREIDGTKYKLSPISLYTNDPAHPERGAAWRIKDFSPEVKAKRFAQALARERKRAQKSTPIEFPFMLHKGETEQTLLLDIHRALPLHWSSELRADMCQDMVTGILSGTLERDALETPRAFVPLVVTAHPLKYEGVPF